MTEQNDDKLAMAARQLATEISPDRDLWPEISRQIAAPPRRGWTPMLAQAAAVVLLIGASSALTYVAMQGQQQPVTQVTPNLLFEPASFGSRHNLGPGFQDARNALVAEFEVELDRLSPESRADVEANLEIARTAIVEINQALEQEPDNALLQEQLVRAYREELNLLRRISGLTRNVMMRNDI